MQTANPLRGKVYVYGREVTWNGPDAEVFHVRGITPARPDRGHQPAARVRPDLTAGHEAQRYGTSWYEGGGFPPGTFQNAEMEVNAAQAAEIRAELVKSPPPPRAAGLRPGLGLQAGHRAAVRGAVHRGDAAQRDADRCDPEPAAQQARRPERRQPALLPPRSRTPSRSSRRCARGWSGSSRASSASCPATGSPASTPTRCSRPTLKPE